jgi:hypothetical protein
VTDLLRDAERILETAASTDGVELESGNLAILIGHDGAIRMLRGTDWPLESLQAHHGSSAAYRVTRIGSQVRVEGKNRPKRPVPSPGVCWQTVLVTCWPPEKSRMH